MDIKQLNTRIQYKYDTETAWNSAGWISEPGEIYVYAPDSTHTNTRMKVGDGVRTVSELPFTEVGYYTTKPENIPLTIVPSQNGTLTYNGSVQTPVWDNYDPQKLILSGSSSGTTAGTYSAIFTPATGYCWADGSTSKEVTWTIEKATSTLTLSQSTVELGPITESIGVTVTTNSDGSITSVSSNNEYISTYVSGTTIYVNSVNKKNITNATVTINLSDTVNYKSASATIEVVTNFFNVGEDLNSTDWSVISDVAAAGLASSYWDIGDLKYISQTGLGGNPFILDFSANRIIFGVDDEKYHEELQTAVKFVGCGVYFQELIGGGGGDYPKWSDCTLRKDLNNTIFPQIEESLRNVIKLSDVHSTYTNGTQIEDMNTQDYIYIPSEVEIFGNDAEYANTSDYLYQKQFEYFKGANSKEYYYEYIDDNFNSYTLSGCFTRCVTHDYFRDPQLNMDVYHTANICFFGNDSYTASADNQWIDQYTVIAPRCGVLSVFQV